MALKATIYKATVNVADLDRNQFLDASLTLARHPSETQERMMLRLPSNRFSVFSPLITFATFITKLCIMYKYYIT